jgi:hypothetical protein
LVLECEGQLGGEKLSKEQEVSAVRLREMREMDRLDRVSDKRIPGRLEAQRRLIEAGWTGQ